MIAWSFPVKVKLDPLIVCEPPLPEFAVVVAPVLPVVASAFAYFKDISASAVDAAASLVFFVPKSVELVLAVLGPEVFVSFFAYAFRSAVVVPIFSHA